MTFEDLAFLLLPADPDRSGTIIEAGERWEPGPPRVLDQDVVLWGRAPLRSGAAVRAALRSAMDRERVLRSIGKTTPPARVEGIHRLPPPRSRGRSLRHRARSALLGGVLVELWRTPMVIRVLDAVAEQAGAGRRVRRFVPGSGGSALVRVPGGAHPSLLRATRSGHPGDPRRAAEALRTLGSLGMRQVPRLLGTGVAAGASWSTESVLPGRRPVRVSRPAAQEIVEICSAFPRSDQPASAHREDFREVAERFPRWARLLSEVRADVDDVALAVPSVARHGDLWAGNVLARRGRLTGIVDWDAWHPAALPGTDLLHLLATEEQARTRRPLGEVWTKEPWRGQEFRSLTSLYWTSMRLVPNDRFLGAVGLAWWACYVAASMRRLPRLAQDDEWIEPNVDRVLEALAGRP